MERGHMGTLISVLLGMTALILITTAVLRYQRDMAAHRARLAQAAPQVIETACGPIEYAETGSGPAVLVIHGNGGGFDQGLTLADYIEPGHRIIAPSRFGYLGTPLPADATVAAQADAHACLLDALGIDQAVVLTSSAGVTSSVDFALRHPERVSALILHSPNAPGEVGLSAPPKAAFTALLRSDFLYWALTTYARPQMQSLVGVPQGFALSPEYQQDVTTTLGSVLPSSRRVDGMVFDTYVGNPVINDIPLEQVRVPTLVVSAVDDPMALHSGARTLAQRIPGARLLPVADGGHMMLGRTAEVREAISSFLRSLGG